MSFPCDGSALQAQLEAWTNVAFDFDSGDFASDDFKPKDDDRSARYAAAGHSSSTPNSSNHDYSFGVDSFDSILGAPAQLVNTPALDPFSTDFAPLGASLVDPALHLPGFSSAPNLVNSNVVAAAPGLLLGPSPVDTSTTPSPPAVPKKSAPKKSKVAAAPVGVQKASAPVSSVLDSAPDSPAPLVLIDGDDEANALAIEEDKRRRNTAASARFRIKKKQREAALEATAKELRDRVVELEKEVEALRTENGWLRGLIVTDKKDGYVSLSPGLLCRRRVLSRGFADPLLRSVVSLPQQG